MEEPVIQFKLTELQARQVMDGVAVAAKSNVTNMAETLALSVLWSVLQHQFKESLKPKPPIENVQHPTNPDAPIQG